jgi:hypothetical protein
VQYQAPSAVGHWLIIGYLGYWPLAIGYWLLAIGYWLLAFVYCLLSIGYWLLAVGCQCMSHTGLLLSQVVVWIVGGGTEW